MAVRSAQTTVTTTATALAITVTDPVTRIGLVVRNRGTVPVYLGGSGVTTATGYQLDPGESIPIDLPGADRPYAVTAAGTAVCHVLQVGA